LVANVFEYGINIPPKFITQRFVPVAMFDDSFSPGPGGFIREPSMIKMGLRKPEVDHI
jgi:hypothetical protein